MTPYELSVLIHHYTSPAKFEHCHKTLYTATVQTFVNQSVFRRDTEKDNGYRVTNLGKAWLQVILQTPLPKQVYADAQDQIIKVE